jgi:hypothetical protein
MSMHSAVQSTSQRDTVLRFALGSFVVLVGAACGFTAVAALSSAFLIARDAGLAGATEVVVYGLTGALVAGVAAGFGAARLSVRRLSRAALMAGVVLAVLLVIAALRIQAVSDARAHLLQSIDQRDVNTNPELTTAS